MKTLADIKQEIASGAEEIREDEYVGKDGILYCKNCRTARIHIMPDSIHALRGMCECQRQAIEKMKIEERRNQLLEDYFRRKKLSNVPELYADNRLKNFIVTENNRKALDAAVEYLQNSEQMRRENIGLYIYGDNSVGKTHLATCLCNELLLQGWSCLFTSVADLLKELEKQYLYQGLVSTSVLKRIRQPDFLIIDDFGKEFAGRENNSNLDRYDKMIEREVCLIINARSVANKPTVFTSNYSKNELRDELRLDEAICERVNEIGTRAIRMRGDDFRKQAQAAKIARMRDLQEKI